MHLLFIGLALWAAYYGWRAIYYCIRIPIEQKRERERLQEFYHTHTFDPIAGRIVKTH
jgi:hypothetical protein